MKICFVGSSNTLFTHAYLDIFSKISNDLSFIDSSREQVRNNKSTNEDVTTVIRTNFSLSQESKMKRFLSKMGLDRSHMVSFILAMKENISSLSCEQYSRVKEHVRENRPDIIIYFWSTTLKQEKKAIDNSLLELGLKAKSILIVNTYPVRTDCNFAQKSIYSIFDKCYFNSFDGLAVPSSEMKEHLRVNGLIEGKKILVSTDVICPFVKRIPSHKKINNDTVDLVFLGNTFFKSRTIDNVEKELVRLTSDGFNVWVQNSRDIEGNTRLNKFEPFGFEDILRGELLNFVDRHDGVLMLYNGLDNARSHCSLPTRFAMALESNVPIFVRSGTFGSLLKNYPNKVFEFSTATDISEIIDNWDYVIPSIEYQQPKDQVWSDFIKLILT
ncbi:hypothetical protein [Ferrimonas gelatinilytica]|uniref:Uncharacterized protein n=1 Tax=Ferrimonas gelatinilytica TaxID=1255257 RepID=A0ABP9RSQ8_9GAMM